MPIQAVLLSDIVAESNMHTGCRVSFDLWSERRCAACSWCVDLHRAVIRGPRRQIIWLAGDTDGRCATHDRLIMLEDFDANILVSNAYFSCQFGCIIGPTGFTMNEHTSMSRFQIILPFLVPQTSDNLVTSVHG